MYANKHLTSNLCSAKNDDPAGRTTCLVEEAQATLDADALDHGEMDSAQSRKGKRREWAHRANLAKWHVESAAKWITSYATQLSPKSQFQPRSHEPLSEPDYHVSQGMEAPGVHLDPDEPGGEVYETVKQLMQLQSIGGDPHDFIPG